MSYGRALGSVLSSCLLACSVAACTAPPHQPLKPTHDLGAAGPTGGGDLGVVGPSDLAGGTTASDADAGPPIPADATIRIHYPVGTHALALRGDTAPLNWNTGVALTAGSDGAFSYVFKAAAAPIQFKPLLDDATWSHGDNYVVHPGETKDVYPHFTATQGTVKQLFAAFHSNILSYDQPVFAYLPASYDENTLARYPVLYMQDGQNLFDPSIAFNGNTWQVQQTLDDASEGQPAKASIADVIVVGPYAGPDRNNIYTPTYDMTEGFGGKGDQYLQMLITELKPQVDQMLRTLPDRANTGILGSSLGGLISAYAGCTHADTFGIIGVMSPSTFWDNEMIVTKVNGMSPPPARPLKVYVDSGDSGPSNDDVTLTAMLAAAYRTVGYADGNTLDYLVQQGGQHSEIYWAQRFPGAAAFLFPR